MDNNDMDNETSDRRNEISGRHAIFGGWQKLEDDDILQDGDETGVISTLLSINHHEPWKPITQESVGKTVAEDCEPDMDGWDRIFRRRKQ